MSLTLEEAVSVLSRNFHRDTPVWGITTNEVYQAGVRMYRETYVGTPLEKQEDDFDRIFSPFEAVAVAEKLLSEKINEEMQSDSTKREG